RIPLMNGPAAASFSWADDVLVGRQPFLHLEAGVPLGQMAAAARLSPYHFAAVQEGQGLPPHQDVLPHRVARAHPLLEAGAVPATRKNRLKRSSRAKKHQDRHPYHSFSGPDPFPDAWREARPYENRDQQQQTQRRDKK